MKKINQNNEVHKKHKLLIELTITLILLVWIVLQSFYVNFRVPQTWPDGARIPAFLCLILLVLDVLKTTSFYNKHPIITIIITFVSFFCISDLLRYFELYICHKDCYRQIGFVYEKNKGYIGSKGMHTDPSILILVSNKIQAGKNIKKTTFNKVNVGDTIIIRVTCHGCIYIKTLFPTHEEIERYKVPQHYINGKLQVKPPYEQYSAAKRDSMLRVSHSQIGYVFEKTDDEYFRHLVKVGIDAEHTTTHEFYETDRNYPKVYKRLNVGDTVILQVSDSMPEINRVLCWQPNEKEIAEYASYKAIKDYSYCSKEFEDKMLLNSHKSLAFVYDKYQDEHIGAYLEVGIDENHTRTYLFKTFEKDYEQIYKTVSIGDTVIAHVSDSIPQLNQVLDWHPTNYYMQIGYIFRKDSRGITKQFNTMVYVGIKKNKLWKHEMSMFKNIHEGDTILMKLSNKDSEYNEVISWHPTPEEIEKYKKPVRITELAD